MKKLYIIAVFALCMGVIYSCSKSGTSNNTINYTVNGIQDITMHNGDSAFLTIATTLVSGNQQPVTLSVSGLPANVTATPVTASGTPSFATVFSFYSNNADTGTYPITITATSAGTTSKTYNFNLAVIPAIDCSSSLAGSYTTAETCMPSSSASFTEVVTTTATAHQISIGNFGNSGQSIIANLNCANDSLTIPFQTITVSGSTFVVTGAGTFNSNTITFNYMISGAFSATCTDVLTK